MTHFLRALVEDEFNRRNGVKNGTKTQAILKCSGEETSMKSQVDTINHNLGGMNLGPLNSIVELLLHLLWS